MIFPYQWSNLLFDFHFLTMREPQVAIYFLPSAFPTPRPTCGSLWRVSDALLRVALRRGTWRSLPDAEPQSSCQNGGMRGVRERESQLRGSARTNVRGRTALHESVIHGRGRLRHGRVSVIMLTPVTYSQFTANMLPLHTSVI
jgi:hypothetical protein